MAGKRGRSGRRDRFVENKRQHVIDKCWEVLNEALFDSSTSLQMKVDIAKPICVKNMPQAVEMPSGIQITLGGILSAAARSKNDSRSVEAMARQSSN